MDGDIDGNDMVTIGMLATNLVVLFTASTGLVVMSLLVPIAPIAITRTTSRG